VVSFTPRRLYLREIIQVPIEWEAEWVSEIVWTFWRAENTVVSAGIRNLDLPVRRLVTALITLPRLVMKALFKETKAKKSLYRPGQALSVPGV
jgi:hypothetical protein